MNLEFKYSLNDLRKQLNSNPQDNTQLVLFDIANLIKGKRYLQYEWQEAIEQIMWRINDIEPAEEAYCDCDNANDVDGMALVNHDPNYTNYVYADDFDCDDADPSPVSATDAKKLINYVANHLPMIKETMAQMDDSYYKMLI